MIKNYKCDVTCSLPPLPPVTNCHTFSDPFPLERDVLYGRPLMRLPRPSLLPAFFTSAVAVFHHSPQNMAKITISAYTSL